MLIKHSVRFRVNGRGLIISNKSKGGDDDEGGEEGGEGGEDEKQKQIKRGNQKR